MRIVRMMAVYNEADVLERNIDWYQAAEIETVAIDNGSQDGSYELLQRAVTNGRLLAVERLETERFDWDLLLGRLVTLARQHAPEWLMLSAPDEFFEPADGTALGTALREDIALGFNLITFHNMEFWMTRLDDEEEPDPLVRMRYYSCYGVQMCRAYPNLAGLDLIRRHGQHPIFPCHVRDRPSTRCYVSRHYKLRSVDQARRNIAPIRPPAGRPGIATQYLNFSGDPGDLLVDPRVLHHYDFDHHWRFDSVSDGRRNRLTSSLRTGALNSLLVAALRKWRRW